MTSDGSKIPVGWVACCLGDLISFDYGKSLPAKTRDDSGTVPVFGSNGVVGVHSHSLIIGPAIIVGRKGSAGEVAFSREACWPIDTTYFVHAPQGLDIHFTYFLLRSFGLDRLDRSTAIPGLNRDDAYALPTMLPSLNEQRRIVEKIETLFARLDKGEEAVRQVQKLLTRYRQSVLKSVVTGQLTANWRDENGASEWKEICLDDVTEFLTSGSRGWAKFYADEGDIFVRAQNIKYDRLELDDIAYVSLPAKSEGKRTRIQKDDLLITITGANVTKTAHVKEDIGTAYVSQHVALFRPTADISSEFLYWFLVGKAAGRKQLEGFAYGAGKPGLNLQNIRDVRLQLPSLEEQHEIGNLLQDAIGKTSVLEEWCETELKRSASLRQSILKDAFAGKLVSQNPADEPASALLARIAAEKPTVKKTRRKMSS